MDDWTASATARAAANGEASNPTSPVTLTQARFFMDDIDDMWWGLPGAGVLVHAGRL